MPGQKITAEAWRARANRLRPAAQTAPLYLTQQLGAPLVWSAPISIAMQGRYKRPRCHLPSRLLRQRPFQNHRGCRHITVREATHEHFVPLRAINTGHLGDDEPRLPRR